MEEEQHLCAECEQNMHSDDVGSCKECGKDTSSGAFQMCGACARRKGVCQVCAHSF